MGSLHLTPPPAAHKQWRVLAPIFLQIILEARSAGADFDADNRQLPHCQCDMRAVEQFLRRLVALEQDHEIMRGFGLTQRIGSAPPLQLFQ